MKAAFALVGALCVASIAAQSDDVPKDRCGLVVASNEDERQEIFVLGHDNQIYHKFVILCAHSVVRRLCRYQLNGEEWSNWASLGGVYLRGGPSVLKAADGRLVLFARGVDRAIWYKVCTYFACICFYLCVRPKHLQIQRVGQAGNLWAVVLPRPLLPCFPRRDSCTCLQLDRSVLSILR